MVIRFKATVMKVGNSLVMVLPKPLCEGFGIVKGQRLDLIVKDEGISIPIQENPIVALVEQATQKSVKRRQAPAEKEQMQPSQTKKI